MIGGASRKRHRAAPLPRCDAQPGSPCRSRGGAAAGAHHTGRFTKVAFAAGGLA
ncbi:zinc finger domain-containing protein [Streptomyces noursei]|uniref:zinc finger domain-containing protein n=1 Tax=Streptomyces noursei TaxID=1971 RepID=UPI003F542668